MNEFAIIAILAVVFVFIKRRTQKQKEEIIKPIRTDIKEAKPHNLIPKDFISKDKREDSSDENSSQRFNNK